MYTMSCIISKRCVQIKQFEGLIALVCVVSLTFFFLLFLFFLVFSFGSEKARKILQYTLGINARWLHFFSHVLDNLRLPQCKPNAQCNIDFNCLVLNYNLCPSRMIVLGWIQVGNHTDHSPII